MHPARWSFWQSPNLGDCREWLIVALRRRMENIVKIPALHGACPVAFWYKAKIHL
jgi:hypothetical protein